MQKTSVCYEEVHQSGDRKSSLASAINSLPYFKFDQKQPNMVMIEPMKTKPAKFNWSK
jgi:hypothetical protein